MPVNSDLEAEAINPFKGSSPEVSASWDLGYHDGIREVPAQFGQAALIAFAVGDHERTLKGLREKLAVDEGQLEKLKRGSKQLQIESEREQKYILPAFGRQSIGPAAWLVVVFYLVLAIIAVSAEFPLSRMTVDEAIGTATTASLAKMGVIRDYSIWAIAVVLCLIGFSLKPLFDVLDRGKGHSRWEAVLVGVALIPCMAAIYGVAQLREAISNPAITIAASNDIRVWTAFTFKWVTVALPLFSAMCLIVSLHQIHNYRRHNRAGRMLKKNDEETTSLDQSTGQLEYAIQHGHAQLEIANKENPYDSDFQNRSLAAYNHGRATGEAELNQRLDGLSPYDRILVKVGAK